MSHSHHSSNGEHGTMKSYVIGFILSLVFTFIPYSLVVNKTVTGTALLVTIVGFALIQMLIQITFFLHIGRGPKPNWNLFFFIATFGIILVVVGGSIMIMNNLHYNMSPEDKVKKLANDEGIAQVGGKETGACKELYDNHQVTIINGQVFPSHTTAGECDTLTFINEDDTVRAIAFGEHPDHGTYAGNSELLVVKKGRNETITLSETGTFQFHDHEQPETAGEFTVE
jgi:cytochrome o ubiquinol oxidase operon protein cyoD